MSTPTPGIELTIPQADEESLNHHKHHISILRLAWSMGKVEVVSVFLEIQAHVQLPSGPCSRSRWIHDKLFPADYLETKETEQHGLRTLDTKTDILTNSILRLQASFIQI
jgi:hypothetical protein